MVVLPGGHGESHTQLGTLVAMLKFKNRRQNWYQTFHVQSAIGDISLLRRASLRTVVCLLLFSVQTHPFMGSVTTWLLACGVWRVHSDLPPLVSPHSWLLLAGLHLTLSQPVA